MKPVFFSLLFALPLLIVSCKRDMQPPRPVPSPDDTEAPIFDTCQCSVPTAKEGDKDYLKADINGVPVCFEVEPVGMDNTFPNMMKWGYITDSTGSSKYYDNLYMIRNAANSHWQMAIFLENTHALSKTYPYNLPRPNPEVCEIGELQLNDMDHYTSCTFCPENKYNYYASFYTGGIAFTATSFDNNVFKGTFSGIARTGSGIAVAVTNGTFSLHLSVFQSDIHL